MLVTNETALPPWHKQTQWYGVMWYVVKSVAVVCRGVSYVCRPWSEGRTRHGRNFFRRCTPPLVPAATSCVEDTWCSMRLWPTPCRCQDGTLQWRGRKHVVKGCERVELQKMFYSHCGSLLNEHGQELCLVFKPYNAVVVDLFKTNDTT